MRRLVRRRWTRALCCLICAIFAGGSLSAQISLASAVDQALKNSPRVRIAEADVAKTLALLQQSRDVYVPSVSVGAGLGQSYGYSPFPPTLATFAAQGLVYNGGQYSYIRSARAGFNAARISLQDARDAVAEDTAVTFAALDRDQQRQEALRQQSELADRLVGIVQERLTAGLDTKIDVTTSQLSAAQIRLALLRAEDETENDRTHLAALVGVPQTLLRVKGGLPPLPAPVKSGAPAPMSPGVSAAFTNARAKQAQAFGDARYLYRPQISLVVQYNRYATFTNSFKQLQDLNRSINIGANEQVYGVQINLPLFDQFHKAKARESAADAARALHEAESLQGMAAENLVRLSHTVTELEVRTEVATLEQQLAQQQLEALLVQVSAVTPAGGPQRTPKDEQNSRIAEREKYLAVLDSTYQLHQAQINLLRQTGELESWISASGAELRPTTK